MARVYLATLMMPILGHVIIHMSALEGIESQDELKESGEFSGCSLSYQMWTVPWWALTSRHPQTDAISVEPFN